MDRIKNDLLYSNLEDIQVVGKEPVRFFCGCSKDMLLPMLRALEKKELTDAYAQAVQSNSSAMYAVRPIVFSRMKLQAYPKKKQ